MGLSRKFNKNDSALEQNMLRANMERSKKIYIVVYIFVIKIKSTCTLCKNLFKLCNPAWGFQSFSLNSY